MCFYLLPKVFKRTFIFHVLLIITFLISGAFISSLMLIASYCFWNYNRNLYHKIIYHLCYSIWCQFTFIAQWWGRLKIRLYIENENINFLGTENALIIMNHKYDVDWLVGWVMAEQYGCLGGTIPFVKEPLKHVPILGWIWRFNGAVFLKRDWTKDKLTISNTSNDLDDFPQNYRKLLLLYPEGTRFTEEKLVSSNKIALSKNMIPLKHCLLPRTRGFVEIVRAIQRNVKVIYDLTLAFPPDKNGDFSDPTMFNILNGNLNEAHLLFRRYVIKDLPLHSDEELSQWIYNLFYQKDHDFDYFLKNGKFDNSSFIIKRRLTDMIVAECFHIVVTFLLLYFIKEFVMNWPWNIVIVFLACAVFCLLVVYLMIRITKTETGSAYGK